MDDQDYSEYIYNNNDMATLKLRYQRELQVGALLKKNTNHLRNFAIPNKNKNAPKKIIKKTKKK